MNRLTLLTATGGRQKAWDLCQKWMLKQTFSGPVRWIIVDDGQKEQEITFERENWMLTIVRPAPFWSEGDNTQARNLKEGLKLVGEDDRLVIIEDDDYYAEDWLEVVNRHLDHSDLIGESCAHYYNVKSRTYRRMMNTSHSSLCSTAMKGSAIKTFEQLCVPQVKFIDINLWRSVKRKALFTGSRVIGIKGLPGRGGIGVGHSDGFDGMKDADGSVLRRFVGMDAKEYL